jgi:hypothetical protein
MASMQSKPHSNGFGPDDGVRSDEIPDDLEPKDITGEVTILDNRPKFMGTYSFVYIGTYKNQTVRLSGDL